MRKIYDRKPDSEKQEIKEEDQKMIINKVNKFMRKIIDKNYLTKYFKNAIKTMDEYYMYRKQFTQYYATNCFLTYILNLTENTPSSIKICLKYSKVFHNECKMQYDKSLKALKNNENKMPFRMSDNIKEFISIVGLQGLFPNTMTCCSLAIKDIKPYLRSIFYLEESTQQDTINEEVINLHVKHTVDKIEQFAKAYIEKQSRSQLR